MHSKATQKSAPPGSAADFFLARGPTARIKPCAVRQFLASSLIRHCNCLYLGALLNDAHCVYHPFSLSYDTFCLDSWGSIATDGLPATESPQFIHSIVLLRSHAGSLLEAPRLCSLAHFIGQPHFCSLALCASHRRLRALVSIDVGIIHDSSCSLLGTACLFQY